MYISSIKIHGSNQPWTTKWRIPFYLNKVHILYSIQNIGWNQPKHLNLFVNCIFKTKYRSSFSNLNNLATQFW